MDPLAASFREDLSCSEADALALARLARERRASYGGTAEDDDEELVVRLRDPRAYGAFAAPLLEDDALSRDTQRALAAFAFDLLPIPADEREAFLVAARAPTELLAIASRLGGDLTAEQVLHLVYAIYLDRALLTAASRRERTAVLHRVLESGERLAALYATMHLAAVPEAEAVRTLEAVLHDSGVPLPTRRGLEHVVRGGPAAWLELAQDEGLLPRDLAADDPEGLANVPRLPESVRRAVR